jgi:ankyrin repeat protein
MRHKKIATAAALVAMACLTSPFWWPVEAQRMHVSGFKRYPPEDFFSGQQLILAQAIRDGDLARVRGLAPKTDLSVAGNKNVTLLSFAVQEAIPVKQDANNDRLRIISELIRDGAKPEQTVGKNGNMAYLAARADNPNLLKALLAGGMSPDQRYDGDTPLIFATAESNLLPQMRVLVEHNANVNLRDSLGETALFDATRLRQWDVVDYLLAHGADPTVVGNGLKYATTLHNELKVTPTDSPQLERINAIGKRIVAAGGQWPPA